VAALAPEERAAYLAMAAEARRLVADDGLPPEVLAAGSGDGAGDAGAGESADA
jgi:hypothetical protein